MYLVLKGCHIWLLYLTVCGGRGEFMGDVLCCIIIPGLVSCPGDKVVSQL